MTRPLTLLALAGAVAMISLAADAAPKKGMMSLDPTKSYFHQTHTQNLKMSCSSCHSTERKDILFLRKDDVVPAAMPGQVDRHVCLGCHNAPSRPTWYGLSAR